MQSAATGKPRWRHCPCRPAYVTAPVASVTLAVFACARYVFSCYKAFGPHLAALYGSDRALQALAAHAPNHPLVDPTSTGAARWELGTPNQVRWSGRSSSHGQRPSSHMRALLV